MYKIGSVHAWDPWGILNATQTKRKYAVVILNRPVESKLKHNVILNIWKNATVRITVDGGTDQWLTWLKSMNIDQDTVAPPELLTGDMDSVTKKALNYFASNGKTRIIITEDQNKTDFTKAILELKRYLCENEGKIDDIMVFTSVSGRFDQLLSNINTLYIAKDILPKVKVYIFGSESLTWLLSEGSHTIPIPLNLRRNQEWCGLLPIGSPCMVTTTGLKWNLNKNILEFGHLVSSSNTYNGEAEVTVEADSCIVWSMGIGNFSDECV